MSTASTTSAYDSADAMHACGRDKFKKMFRRAVPVERHVTRAKMLIAQNSNALNIIYERFHLDVLLTMMLEHAPSLQGKRYVAIVIILAGSQGADMLVKVAQQWVDFFFKPMLGKVSQSRPKKEQSWEELPLPAVTPSFDKTAVALGESMSRKPMFRLQVLIRDNNRCVVTGRNQLFSNSDKTVKSSGSNPIGMLYGNVQAAHIIPFHLTSYKRKAFKRMTATWDILCSWTGLSHQQVSSLTNGGINETDNGILLDVHAHSVFDQGFFYFEECANIKNKYIAISSIEGVNVFNDVSKLSVEVEFGDDFNARSAPSPLYLKIHAAIAKCVIPAQYPQRFPNWAVALVGTA